MNPSGSDAWFFSRDGQQTGPITFTDLKIRASEGMLRPRQDLVWHEGMPDWRPVGEIEGLFERKILPETEATDPYRAPAELAPHYSTQDGTPWPGARRRSYLFVSLILPFLWQIALEFINGSQGGRLEPGDRTLVLQVASLFPTILGIWFSIQRVANLGMSRWWFLAGLVPLLNVWIGYRMFACPAGYAQHKRLDGVGVFLAIIYWLVIALVILALVAAIAIVFGVIGNPETQEQLKNLLEQIKAQAEVGIK